MNVYENTKNTNDQDTSSIVCDLFSSSLSISNASSSPNEDTKSEEDAVGLQTPIKTKCGQVFDDSSILKDPPPIHEPGYYDHYLFLRVRSALVATMANWEFIMDTITPFYLFIVIQ